jgi:hypothetical protein
MCLHLAQVSLEAWLASQERMMRAWEEELSLDPTADQAQLRRLEAHRQWLRQELETVTASHNGRHDGLSVGD